MLSLIVARGRNGVIGNQGEIPWRMPGDMAFFKATTMGKPIIMGRKTWESLPKALPGRQNIVVTRNPKYVAEGAEVVTSIDEALELTAEASEVMLIGGAQLYEQALPRVEKAYITEIQQDFEGDAWFSDLDAGEWQLQSEEHFAADERNAYAYIIRVYTRL